MEKPTNDLTQLLRDCGREVSDEWLQSAVKDAESPEQMNNQIKTLHFAAVHILAAEMYNQGRQLNIPPEAFISALDKELRYEMVHYADQGLELAGHKNSTT